MDEWQYDSAKDGGLTPGQRMRSIKRESGLVAWASQYIAMAGVKAYLKTYHRYRIEGFENLPKQPSYVLVSNHTSHLDTLCLAAAIHRRHSHSVFPIAAGDTFFKTPSTAWFSAMTLNALPMWRKHCGPHALHDLRARLEEMPSIYILFPEGTRSRDGRMGDFKAGLGMLVAGGQVPVVPCYLRGGFSALPSNRHVPRPSRLLLRIGEPMFFSNRENSRTDWNLIAKELRGAVGELGGVRVRDKAKT